MKLKSIRNNKDNEDILKSKKSTISSGEDFALNHNPNDIVDFLVESDEYTEPYQLHLQKGAWSNQIKILVIFSYFLQ